MSGNANPLMVGMTTNRIITAYFGPDYGVCGTLRADYQLQSNLLSSVGAPPALNYYNTAQYFTNQPVDGLTRTTLRFPQGSGLVLSNATAVIPSNTYTMVLFFRFDTVSGWRRILDLKNGSPDNGLYALNGYLNFYPTGVQSPAVCVTNGTWHQVVVTRDLSGQVVVYSDGVQRLSFADNNGYAVINAANTIRLFKDNTTEESAGSVARIRLFTCALSPAEVAALDRAPVMAPIVLTDLALDPLGRFFFKVNGPPLPLLRVQRSEDLINWFDMLDVPGFPGAVWVTNPPAPSADHRFFRALRP